MRLISCSLTQPQIENRSKTETRRLRWLNAKPGDLLCVVDKCMGLKPGQKPQRLAIIYVTKVDREPLNSITPEAVVREGFPDLDPAGFVSMFSEKMRCQRDEPVTAIRYLFIPGGRF